MQGTYPEEPVFMGTAQLRNLWSLMMSERAMGMVGGILECTGGQTAKKKRMMMMEQEFVKTRATRLGWKGQKCQALEG